MRALERQARTSSELAKLLTKRGIPDEVAERLLGRFVEVGLIDDEAFAQAWVTDRQERRSLSKRALRAELSRKGVDKDDIEQAVDAVSSEDEYNAALRLARSTTRRLAELEPHVARRRLAAALVRRGFSSGVVMSVTRTVLEECDEDIDGYC